MNEYMSNKLDAHLTNIKELEQTIIAFKQSFDHAMDERDMMRGEIARLQGEVQRLQLANADAVHALTRVSKLNPNCAEIGAGMLATIISESTTALIKMGEMK